MNKRFLLQIVLATLVSGPQPADANILTDFCKKTASIANKTIGKGVSFFIGDQELDQQQSDRYKTVQRIFNELSATYNIQDVKLVLIGEYTHNTVLLKKIRQKCSSLAATFDHCSWGNIIFLSPRWTIWSENDIRQALIHELHHIKNNHSLKEISVGIGGIIASLCLAEIISRGEFGIYCCIPYSPFSLYKMEYIFEKQEFIQLYRKINSNYFIALYLAGAKLFPWYYRKCERNTLKATAQHLHNEDNAALVKKQLAYVQNAIKQNRKDEFWFPSWEQQEEDLLEVLNTAGA